MSEAAIVNELAHKSACIKIQQTASAMMNSCTFNPIGDECNFQLMMLLDTRSAFSHLEETIERCRPLCKCHVARGSLLEDCGAYWNGGYVRWLPRAEIIQTIEEKPEARLTHLPLVLHICVIESCKHLFR